MTLPKELTTVTPLSKAIALTIFIVVPIIAFFLGIKYQSMIATDQLSQPLIIYVPVSSPAASHSAQIADWKTYLDKYISFKYPPTWNTAHSLQSLRSVVTLADMPVQIIKPGVDERMDVSKSDEFVNVVNGGYYDQANQENIDFSRWVYIYANGNKTTKVAVDGREVVRVEYTSDTLNHITVMFDGGKNSYYTIDFNYLNTNPSKISQYKNTFDQILSTFKFTAQNQATSDEKGRVFLTKDLVDENNKLIKDVYLLLPTPDVENIQYLSTAGYVRAKITMSGNEYIVAAVAGGKGGPCPMGDFAETKCGYEDEKLSFPLNTITASNLRIWHDENGIFMLNPWGININGFSLNHLEITKNSPNKVFTQNEVDKWRTIIQSINNQ